MSGAAAAAGGDTLLRGFPPVVGPAPRVLILGSMPGGASLAAHEYYAHPRNAFWPIMASLAGAGPELPYAERLARLRRVGIALWDVVGACRRKTSLDAHIDPRSIEINPLVAFIGEHPTLRAVFFNGGKAEELFRRHAMAEAVAVAPTLVHTRLPSTSPAHAALDTRAKRARWAVVARYLDKREAR